MDGRGGSGRGGFRAWLAAAGGLVFAGVVVPYGLLGGGDPGLGVTSFWILFGLGVVALILVGLRGWRD